MGTVSATDSKKRPTSVGQDRDQDPHGGTAESPHPRGDDDRLEALKHRLDGQGGIHTAVDNAVVTQGRVQGGGLAQPMHGCISPEVQDGVGDAGGPVIKGLDYNGEAWWKRMLVSPPHLSYLCVPPDTLQLSVEPGTTMHNCPACPLLLRLRSREAVAASAARSCRWTRTAFPRQLGPPACHPCFPHSSRETPQNPRLAHLHTPSMTQK